MEIIPPNTAAQCRKGQDVKSSKLSPHTHSLLKSPPQAMLMSGQNDSYLAGIRIQLSRLSAQGCVQKPQPIMGLEVLERKDEEAGLWSWPGWASQGCSIPISLSIQVSYLKQKGLGRSMDWTWTTLLGPSVAWANTPSSRHCSWS